MADVPKQPPVVSKFMASLPAIGHSITGLFVLLVGGMQANPDMAAEYGFPAGIIAILGQVVAYVSSQKNQKDTEKAKTVSDMSLSQSPNGVDEISHNLGLLQGKAAGQRNAPLVEALSAAIKVHASRGQQQQVGG